MVKIIEGVPDIRLHDMFIYSMHESRKKQVGGEKKHPYALLLFGQGPNSFKISNL